MNNEPIKFNDCCGHKFSLSILNKYQKSLIDESREIVDEEYILIGLVGWRGAILSRDQVKDLIKHLQSFAEKGEI